MYQAITRKSAMLGECKPLNNTNKNRGQRHNTLCQEGFDTVTSGFKSLPGLVVKKEYQSFSWEFEPTIQ